MPPLQEPRKGMAEQAPLLPSFPRYGGSLGVQTDLICALGFSINWFSGERLSCLAIPAVEMFPARPWPT